MKTIFVKYQLEPTNTPVIGNYKEISKKYINSSVYIPIDSYLIKYKHV